MHLSNTKKIPFTDEQVYQIFKKTNGLCHKCLKPISFDRYITNHSGSWFILNQRDKVIVGQKRPNFNRVNPFCFECAMDAISVKVVPNN